MSSKTSLAAQFALVVIAIGLFVFLMRHNLSPISPATGDIATTTQVSASAAAVSTTTTETEMPEPATPVPSTPIVDKTKPQSQEKAAPDDSVAERVQDPYTIPALAPEAVNIAARAALVNIFCYPHNGNFRPVSGSGVIIDPRGIILTNAHVAQYVLLSQSARVDLSCYIRSGAPAAPHWLAQVLYIPPAWVNAHVADIKADHPLGTGEHDYALLAITTSIDNSPLPNFPYLMPDVREAIAFVDDPLLVASYPAEFVGAAATFSLYPTSSFTTVKELLTFTTNSVDVISVGSVIGAQSGSSGGGIVNPWGRLVGVITTTSPGATTGERELRGITLSYVDRDLLAQTGSDLRALLASDTIAATAAFMTNTAPGLIDLFLAELE